MTDAGTTIAIVLAVLLALCCAGSFRGLGVFTTAPNATAPYETLTMVSCVDVLGIPTKEVVFAMRVPLDAGNHALLDKMKTTARRLGVEWDESKLKEVSFDKC